MHKNRKTGHSFVELMGMGVVAVPILLTLIDLYFLIIGYWWTMNHCQLAARAAAQGSPSAVILNGPKNRAAQYLNVSGADSNSTIQLTDYSVEENIVSLPDPATGGAVNGTVTVLVEAEVTPPFLLKMAVPGQKFVVRTSQTCQFTCMQPAKTAVSSVRSQLKGY